MTSRPWGVHVQCPECDTELQAGARFCRHCGAPSDDPDRTDAHERVTGVGQTDGDETAPHTPEDLETSVIATPSAAEGASRRCPSCGAPNSPRRELCGRCGVDLETGVSPPRAAEDEQPSPARRAGAATSQRHRTQGWLIGLGGLAVVVAVVVGLTLAGLGPLAGAPSLPEADFETDVYGDEPEVLVLSDIATSSALEPSGGETYDATQMVDDDPTTAWNSDGSQAEHGVGETIDLFFADPVWVQRLVFDNGFQRDAESYADNARIRRADVLLDGGERLSIRLEDLGLQRQAIELPEPLLTTTVRIEVTETFPGDTYPDLAVSDIALEGWPARGEDVEVAQERAERARAAPPTR
jgi:hypothetical protein